jgi:CBS-domain-containing membrane protein
LLAELGTVRQVMTTAILTLPPDMRIFDAMALLRATGLVGRWSDAGRLIGVVTQADLFAHPEARAAPLPSPKQRRPSCASATS